MKKSIIKNYARLIVEVGANVQKGQDVIINSDISNSTFISYLVEYAYKRKARTVKVNWTDQNIDKINFKYGQVKNLAQVEDWEKEKMAHQVRTLPALIYIESNDPDGLKGVNQDKVTQIQTLRRKVFKPYRDEMDCKYQWTIAGYPSYAWAKKVFPNDTKKIAYEKLFKAILETSRAYIGDPIENWKEHNENLNKKTSYLNSLNLDYLHYYASNGTDFKVWLMDDGLWLAGSEKTLNTNIVYNPNIPSEECFTTPRKGKAEGIVYSSKPLSFQGQLIEDFYIRFKDGKAIEAKARVNEELLNKMINMDEGASYLGECALVPFDSPINNTNILFYSTLYDENASCHLALGAGFNNCVKDYEKYSLDELKQKGVNDSISHVDFMIGTDDLNIDGYSKDGKKIAIFRKGNWAF